MQPCQTRGGPGCTPDAGTRRTFERRGGRPRKGQASPSFAQRNAECLEMEMYPGWTVSRIQYGGDQWRRLRLLRMRWRRAYYALLSLILASCRLRGFDTTHFYLRSPLRAWRSMHSDININLSEQRTHLYEYCRARSFIPAGV